MLKTLMSEWIKPSILVSKCLEFDHCRYDGSMISSDFVKKIKPYVSFIPVCAELEIGLGVPRKSLRLIQQEDEKRMVQPATSTDFTEEMISFATSFLKQHQNVHGVVLKSRSPSCGIKDVKIYPASKNAAPLGRTAGLFGEMVLKLFPGVVETEGRLRNIFIQEHFLVSIYTLADFETVKNNAKIKDLITFHSKNKFLMMAYNQNVLHKLGRITANQDKSDIHTIIDRYEQLLYSLFSSPPSHKQIINVLLHLFGFISDKLSKEEKKFFLDLIDKYRNEKISLNVITHVLRSWVIRFAEPYLSKQTFFHPFPEELLEEQLSVIADQQRYWK